MAKDILDKKTSTTGRLVISSYGAGGFAASIYATSRSAASIPVVTILVLRFLQIEKQKLILI